MRANVEREAEVHHRLLPIGSSSLDSAPDSDKAPGSHAVLLLDLINRLTQEVPLLPATPLPVLKSEKASPHHRVCSLFFSCFVVFANREVSGGLSPSSSLQLRLPSLQFYIYFPLILLCLSKNQTSPNKINLHQFAPPRILYSRGNLAKCSTPGGWTDAPLHSRTTKKTQQRQDER
jgi:hypothetical protein